MQRLVYAPYVQAFIHADDGVVDVSPYIVRGSVNRKVNQVSSAQLTLRNPVQGNTSDLLFTEYRGASGTAEPHPMFHPMDPIIIVMQRIQGNPLQVFTGYVDKSPYLQLYPGLCTIEASCTLKRLLYTQWDASLPWTTRFLSNFGWNPTGSGVWNTNADTASQFNDGSLGALLFAVLRYIGDWDKSVIWIEALPPQIQPLVLALYNRIQPEVEQSSEQFQSLLNQIIGSGSQGSGGPGSGVGGGSVGATTDLSKAIPAMIASANSVGIPPLFVLATSYNETNFSSSSVNSFNSSNCTGWFQFHFPSTDPNGTATLCWYANTATVAQAHDPGYSSLKFSQAVKSRGGPPLDQGQWGSWAAGFQVAGSYPSWDQNMPTVQHYYDQYKNAPPPSGASTAGGPAASTAPSNSASATGTSLAKSKSGRSPGGKTGATTSTSTTRYQVIVEAANAIDGKHFPYVWGGGHGSAGIPTSGGFDCSGAVSAVLFAAGLTTSSFDTMTMVSTVSSNMVPGIDNSANAVNIFLDPNSHVYMQIGGQYWGTWAGGSSKPGGGGWCSDGSSTLSGFSPYHIPQNLLTATATNALPAAAGGPGGSQTLPGGATGATGSGGNSPWVAAFSTMLNLPSIFDSADAQLLTGKRSFIADQPLFPFIQQLCQASMREFMSMPNGNFFAFFPDYFGLFGRQFYWEIHDIEIIDGRIDLSDDALLTNVAVAGDAWVTGAVQFQDKVTTAGVFDILDAFATGYVGNFVDISASKVTYDASGGKQAALAFLQKYGARGYVEEVPAIRSPIYELFLAFQNFMRAWSAQYHTTFEFTFMPELFPGGLVSFPEHHIQCYVDEVVHNFDYASGFTTTATLSSPSGPPNDGLARKNLRQGVARPAVLGASPTPNNAQSALGTSLAKDVAATTRATSRARAALSVKR